MGQHLFCPITPANTSILLQTESVSGVHRPGEQFMLLGQYMGLFVYSCHPVLSSPPPLFFKNVNSKMTKKAGKRIWHSPQQGAHLLYNKGS